MKKQFRKVKKIKLLKADGHMKTITREKYLDRMIALRGTPDIKIITEISSAGYLGFTKTERVPDG